ncbi:MAG: AraC family transcriptional regulator [Agathobacter sp.]|nr:AraC family transcriptional regulator [Agathobacter sp.]
MIRELKENVVHGTKEYPYEQYNIRNRYRTFQIPVHWHDEMEIIAIERGQLEIKIGEDNFIGRAGDIFFVNPRELHLMGPSEIDGLYYTLLFPIEFISFQTQDALETELLSPIRSNKLLFPHQLQGGIKEMVYPFLQEIINSNMQKHDIGAKEISLSRHHLRTRILLLEMLECLYENGALLKSETNGDTNMQKEMLAYIDAHCMEKITLSMLAEEFHLSEKYVSRYFVEHFKISFSNYVIHHRLTYARALLETTDEQVTEIAMQSGFFNVSYFIRAFKKMYGISPLKYRKKQ